ncbi:MAG: hypothetical protein M1399_08355 [Actinobacteria bacterium]|nr:hypothetical protein [Actinomycetota bacterium]MCL5446853.1 hypothetical protein [Actinomycetota bacterium]
MADTENVNPVQEGGADRRNGGSRWVWALASAVMAAVLVAGVLFLVLPGGSGVPVKKVALQANSRSPGKGTSSTTTSTSKPAGGSNQKAVHIAVPAGQSAISAATAHALIQDAVVASSKAVYTATYQVTKGNQISTSFTVVQDPPNSKLSVTSQGISITGYNLSSGSYECFEHSAGAGAGGFSSLPAGKTVCIKSTQAFPSSSISPASTFVEGVQAAVSRIASQVSKYKAASVSMFTEGTRNMLGMQLHCVNMVSATVSICFTAQDVVGYVTGSSGQGAIELTSYSTSIPAGAFTLPSKPLSQSALTPPSSSNLPPLPATGSSSGG